VSSIFSRSRSHARGKGNERTVAESNLSGDKGAGKELVDYQICGDKKAKEESGSPCRLFKRPPLKGRRRHHERREEEEKFFLERQREKRQ
jgi:hypothetical protein